MKFVHSQLTCKQLTSLQKCNVPMEAILHLPCMVQLVLTYVHCNSCVHKYCKPTNNSTYTYTNNH